MYDTCTIYKGLTSIFKMAAALAITIIACHSTTPRDSVICACTCNYNNYYHYTNTLCTCTLSLSLSLSLPVGFLLPDRVMMVKSCSLCMTMTSSMVRTSTSA